MQILVAQEELVHESQLRQRLKEIERSIERLRREEALVARRLERIRSKKAAGGTRAVPVSCPKCGRDRDFMVDRGGYLGHVLEDPDDVEDLEPGKPIFCPACGDVFLYARAAAPTPKTRR